MIAAAQLASLLAAAEATLREDIQPHLAAAQRYPAAMVANALRIAARSLAQGADVADAERAALATLYPDDPSADLGELQRRLAAELRVDGVTPEREQRIRAVLRARTLARLALTNPDYPKTYRA